MIRNVLHQYKLGSPFYLYFLSFVINFFGSGIQGIALPWLLLEMTGSSVSVGLLLTIRAIPGIVIAPFAGYIADALNKKKICFWINLFQGGSIFSIVILNKTFVDHAWILYLMAFFVAVGNAFFLPAIKALLQVIMQKDELLKANSLTESCTQMGMIIGTGTGGYLVYQFGALNVILLDSVTFILSAFLIVLIPYSIKKETIQKRPLFLQSQREAFSYIRRDLYIFGLIGFLMIPTLCVQTNNVLVGAFTMNELHLDASAFGRMNASYAIGAMVTGFIIPYFSKMIMNHIHFLFFFLLTLALSVFFLGQSHGLMSAIIPSFFIGVGISSSRTWITTRIMRDTDDRFAGRVHSLTGLLSAVATLFIGLVIGGVAESSGYRTVYYILSSFVFCTALLSLFLFSKPRLNQHSRNQMTVKE